MIRMRPTKDGIWSLKPKPFYGELPLGNGTLFTVGAFELGFDGRLFVGIEGHGAYTFNGFVSWNYAAEKLGLLEGDARNVADWINAQLNINIIGSGRGPQGFYDERFCA